MGWLDKLLGRRKDATPTDSTEEAREQAGAQSMRPDIQAGALRHAEGEDPEPQVHEHPSYRETAQEREENA